MTLVLNAITTKSGSVVKPYWFKDEDGRLEFRGMDWVLTSARPRWHYNTGKSAQTREEAWGKALEWAREN